MARPTGITEWATDPAALKAAPSENMQRFGFDTRQPRAGHLNWLVGRLYEWVDYFKDAPPKIPVGGFVRVAYSAARPYQSLPWSLPSEGKRAALEVYRQVNRSLGGLAPQNNSYSVPVAAGEESERRFSVRSAITARITFDAYRSRDDRFSYEGTADLYTRYGGVRLIETARGNSSITLSARASELYASDYSLSRERGISTINLSLAAPHTGSLATSTLANPARFRLPGSRSYARRWNIRNFIGAGTRALVYEAPASGQPITNWAILNNSTGLESVSSAYNPLTVNRMAINPSGNPASKGFTETSSAAIGSTLTDGISPTAQGTPDLPFELKDYRYDPAEGEIKASIVPRGASPPAITKASFLELEITDAAGNVTRLLASAATIEDFEASGKTFKWSAAADPLLAGGTASFRFGVAGTGLPAFGLDPITDGAIIEGLGGTDYLRFLSSAGLNDGDFIYIRRV